MQSRFRSRHKAGFGAAGLGTAQSWFWSRHKASFYIYFLYIYFIYIFILYIRIYIYKRIYKEKTYIKNIYIYVYTHNQSLVLDTKHVLYWPVLEQIQFCSFDRSIKLLKKLFNKIYQQYKDGFKELGLYSPNELDTCIEHASLWVSHITWGIGLTCWFVDSNRRLWWDCTAAVVAIVNTDPVIAIEWHKCGTPVYDIIHYQWFIQ